MQLECNGTLCLASLVFSAKIRLMKLGLGSEKGSLVSLGFNLDQNKNFLPIKLNLF